MLECYLSLELIGLQGRNPTAYWAHKETSAVGMTAGRCFAFVVKLSSLKLKTRPG